MRPPICRSAVCLAAAFILLAGLIAACRRPPASAPLARASPPPLQDHTWLTAFDRIDEPRGAPPPLRELPPNIGQYGPPATPEAAAKQAAELLREYHTDPEFTSRVEVVARLADASSPQSRQALSQLFHAEKDLDLRVQMVHALPFVESEDLAPSLAILQEALRPTQPRELREAAADTMQTLNDPRLIPLLQTLLADPDAELRETAGKTIEYYREVLQLGVP